MDDLLKKDIACFKCNYFDNCSDFAFKYLTSENGNININCCNFNDLVLYIVNILNEINSYIKLE